MNPVILFFLNVFLTCIECIALYLFSSCFFSCRCHSIKLIISLCLLAITNIAAYAVTQGSLIAKLVAITIVDMIWINLSFQASAVKSLIAALFYCSFLTLVDGALLMGIAVITKQDIQTYSSSPYIYYLVCYAIKIVELLGIVILRLWSRGRNDSQAATWHDWVRTLMFPIASMILSVILIQTYTIAESTATMVLCGSIILVITDILAILLLNYLEQQQRQIHDYSILRHDLKMEQDNISAWMNAYDNQRKQTHEYQNQLSLLRGLAEQEAPNGELVQYLAQLLQTDLSVSMFVKTGRTVVDVILNQKNAIAQEKRISLKVHLDDLSNFALPDDALTIVLSNLIDNAIEACEQVKDASERRILLKMQVSPRESIIYIENFTANPVKVINNQVMTTKTDAMAHGYGLKNVQAVLSQVDAVYAIEYREADRIFCFSAQIIPPGC